MVKWKSGKGGGVSNNDSGAKVSATSDLKARLTSLLHSESKKFFVLVEATLLQVVSREVTDEVVAFLYFSLIWDLTREVFLTS